VQSLESTQKKANSEVKEAEKILEKATAALNDATRRARSVATEVVEATKTVEVAKRAIEQATKELESLLRQSPV
jgi:chromosome segregation ATPase